MMDWITWVLQRVDYKYYDVFLEDFSEEERDELYSEYLDYENEQYMMYC